MSVLSLICTVYITSQNVRTVSFEAAIVKYDIRSVSVPVSTPSTSQTVEYVYTAVTSDGEIVEYWLGADEECTLRINDEQN